MIKLLLFAMIAGLTVKPGTVERVNRDIVTINDGSDFWDVYGGGMEVGEHVNMIMVNNMVIGLF